MSCHTTAEMGCFHWVLLYFRQDGYDVLLYHSRDGVFSLGFIVFQAGWVRCLAAPQQRRGVFIGFYCISGRTGTMSCRSTAETGCFHWVLLYFRQDGYDVLPQHSRDGVFSLGFIVFQAGRVWCLAAAQQRRGVFIGFYCISGRTGTMSCRSTAETGCSCMQMCGDSVGSMSRGREGCFWSIPLSLSTMAGGKSVGSTGFTESYPGKDQCRAQN